MKTVYKYPLRIASEQTIALPHGFQILHFGLDPQETPCIWVLVEPDNRPVAMTFYTYGTGQPFKKPHDNYVGTIVKNLFVWHLFY